MALVDGLRVALGVIGSIAGVAAAVAASAPDCVPAGAWITPSAQGPVRVSGPELTQRLAQRPVVLLGELHDRAEHHRWQLQTMAALYAQRRDIVLGFEMFPRRVQEVLDSWVAGELTEAEFIERSDWVRVWGIETAQYLPLFHFARMNRIPMIALNVERDLIREIGRKGADAVPDTMREGVGRPAPASPEYLRELHTVYLDHAEAKSAGMDDPAFLRFVEGQLTWDRAMAEAISSARRHNSGHQVIAVMGRGHTGPGAVPNQLRALGINDTAVLLPWERDGDCSRLVPGVAEAVFGVDPPRAAPAGEPRPRLGVILAPADSGGVRIDRVVEGSVAASAGLRARDVLVTMAGKTVKTIADVQLTVGRQAPGTWLPLRVRREADELELIAKFPPQ